MSLYSDLAKKKEKLAVVGVGYAGLPLALEFAKNFSVIGFDIDEEKLEQMRKGVDPSNEVPSESFLGRDIEFSSSAEDLNKACFFVIAVPTPIDKFNLPDIRALLSATKTVGKALRKGGCVVYESTVYPGCTEEKCVPVLEKASGLKAGADFKFGYSPERINPGDRNHTLTKIIRVVSGCDEEASEIIARVYNSIVSAGIHKAPSIKVAEAAKIVENTQRDVNIALMNELAIVFNRMGIDIADVLEAARTKWNFLNFYPGLVGGHCIGVDPYYLLHKAKEVGYHAQMINSSRAINDLMGRYIAEQTVKRIIAARKNLNEAKVLVMGITFKENVSDIRNSRVADVISELKAYGVEVEVVDPHASAAKVRDEYGIELAKETSADYDAVIVAVAHRAYEEFDEEFFKSILRDGGIVIDIRGIYRDRIKKLGYWSL